MTDGATAGAEQPEASDGPDEQARNLKALGAAPLSPQDPEMVGRYRIHALLGVGGMGRVYLGRATDASPDAGPACAGSWVAVKVIRPDLADSPEFRRRFAHELEAVRRVDTPYVAALVHGDSDADQPWMATEFVPGIALGDAVKPGEPLPDAAIWRLAHDLGSALIAVHWADIVHRDVKPSNVILGSMGAKVIDFGVARAADLTQVTSTGLNVGTPNFMAPEQARASGITPASDIFALGVLLYFAASGKVPFGEGLTSASAVLFRVVYEEPDLSGLDDVEPGLRDLIVRCLAKDPFERPSAMGVVARAKAAAIGGRWEEGESAGWPPALAARIRGRTCAAGRELPVAAPAGAPPVPPKDGTTMLVAPVPVPEQRRTGRRHGIAVATAVVAVGLIAMFAWGSGNDGNAGNQAGPAGDTVGAVMGLGGSSSPGAGGATASGPGSARTSANSYASGAAGASGSASDGPRGQTPTQSSNASPGAGGGSVSAAPSDPWQQPSASAPPSSPGTGSLPPPTPPSPTASPVSTGCTGWTVQHIGSDTGQAESGKQPTLYTGPYSLCRPTTGPPAAHGDTLDLWCYIVNASGTDWSYVQDVNTSTYGWIPNEDLAGGAGASNAC
ncbi:serine/threonine-protein kinase [Actinospica sp.]|uniref:serine/threonine-protein kinase n=1 Tax=Actinospica sp. TaxID=1872142 RepID=UPI002B6732AC|nr:serine/threonine-protein kinase [Actinospica sp.]HWG27787.1 serine/threonine-protein kinase [Actinospica sp.]